MVHAGVPLRARSRSTRCGRRPRTSAGGPRRSPRAGSRCTPRRCRARRGRGPAGGGRSRPRRRWPPLPGRARRSALLWSSIDSSTSSIASTSSMTSCGHGAGAADLQDPAALDVDHLPPPPVVGLAGVLLPLRADALPGGEVAATHPVADGRGDVVRVVGGQLVQARRGSAWEAWCSTLARIRASAARVGRGHLQASRHPRQRGALQQQRAGGDEERDQEQHVAVGRLGRDDERRGQRDHAAHARPSRAGRCRSTAGPCRCRRGRAARARSGRRTPTPSGSPPRRPGSRGRAPAIRGRARLGRRTRWR